MQQENVLAGMVTNSSGNVLLDLQDTNPLASLMKESANPLLSLITKSGKEVNPLASLIATAKPTSKKAVKK